MDIDGRGSRRSGYSTHRHQADEVRKWASSPPTPGAAADRGRQIRDCVTCIVERRPLACGLVVCHPAPCAQPARVPYGHGGFVGTPFEYRTGSMAQVYLVAPARRFVERAHGPLTGYDETQLRAYHRSTPDMQHPAPVFGSTPLSRRLGFPQPPTPSPRREIPALTVATTPNRDIPPTPRTSHSDDASLLRQYHQIVLFVSSRRAVNPTRGSMSYEELVHVTVGLACGRVEPIRIISVPNVTQLLLEHLFAIAGRHF